MCWDIDCFTVECIKRTENRLSHFPGRILGIPGALLCRNFSRCGEPVFGSKSRRWKLSQCKISVCSKNLQMCMLSQTWRFTNSESYKCPNWPENLLWKSQQSWSSVDRVQDVTILCDRFEKWDDRGVLAYIPNRWQKTTATGRILICRPGSCNLNGKCLSTFW